MPEKIRKLKAKSRKAGFVERPAKGSHTFWYDPSDSVNHLLLAGQDGDDADKYKIKAVNDALKKKEKGKDNATVFHYH